MERKVMPFYKFMTGAHSYRCEAANQEEALAIAFASLDPTPEARAVILATIYEEEAGRAFVDPAAVPKTKKKRHLRSVGTEEDGAG